MSGFLDRMIQRAVRDGFREAIQRGALDDAMTLAGSKDFRVQRNGRTTTATIWHRGIVKAEAATPALALVAAALEASAIVQAREAMRQAVAHYDVEPDEMARAVDAIEIVRQALSALDGKR